jgi:hypothetical protein
VLLCGLLSADDGLDNQLYPEIAEGKNPAGRFVAPKAFRPGLQVVWLTHFKVAGAFPSRSGANPRAGHVRSVRGRWLVYSVRQEFLPPLPSLLPLFLGPLAS